MLGSCDRRFDGQFFVAVTSTGVYCRPSCPAIVPKRANVRFYPTAAAAQAAGFRACLRCHPHAVPGSPLSNQRGDLAARALALIADGVVDREGVGALARRLSYSERHLHRQLQAELGAGQLALARFQRAQTARLLIHSTRLPMIDLASAAGFASVRQFNDTIRRVYGRTPTQLRAKAPRHGPAAGAQGALTLRLHYRPPLHWDHLLAFLAAPCRPLLGQQVSVAARALTHGEIVIDPGSDRDEVRARLMEIPGIGQWTTGYIAMRALADPDAFLPTDLGVKHALARLLGRGLTPKEIAGVAQGWQPWRAYALQHLWASCVGPSNPASSHAPGGDCM